MEQEKSEIQDDCCSLATNKHDRAEDTAAGSKIKTGILFVLIFLVGLLYYYSAEKEDKTLELRSKQINLEEGKSILPIKWGDLGAKMVSVGALDPEKLQSLYGGKLKAEDQALLAGRYEEKIVMTEENAHLLLLLFWGLGLGNKNDILEKGPMADYGDMGNFASTGGWTLARGEAMDHYSRHPLVILTPEQQQLVERVSKNIYRPCCNNPTYFPDCNHGMAILGLLELMASQGTSEDELYRTALRVNSYWFPETYSVIARHFQNRGVDYDKVNPKEILGAAYSSASGYRRVLSEIDTLDAPKGGSCGV